MLKSILGGAVAFIIVFVTLSFLLPAAACRDGWKSGAIGRMGACSHHGGVDRTIDGIRFLFSLGAAFAAGFYIRHREQKPPPTNHPQQDVAALSSCPKCRSLISKYEKTDGTQLRECCNPACKWTSDAGS